MKPWFVPIPVPRVWLIALEDDQLTFTANVKGSASWYPYARMYSQTRGPEICCTATPSR